MSKPAEQGYEFLEDIAIADVAFRAWAPDLESLFWQCGEATTAVMVDDPSQVEARVRRTVELRDEANPEWLLFDFLQEIIYFKDAEALLLRPQRVSVTDQGGAYALQAELAGETIDPQRHALNADVKAVTMHRFALRHTNHGFEAEVVLDI